MEAFTKRVVYLIENIPEGQVMTYGQVAQVAGNKSAARQVAWILSSMSKKYKLPWHRVINAKGEISHTGSEQRELLELEGIEFSLRGKVDLNEYQYHPVLKHH